MNTRVIEYKAKLLAKYLIIGCASTMILAGCSTKEHNVPKSHLSEQLHDNVWNSASLNKTSKRYFDNNFISDPDSDGPTHNGLWSKILWFRETNSRVNIDFTNHEIGVDNKNGHNTKDFITLKDINNNDKSYSDMSDESDDEPPKQPEEKKMHYHVNNKKHTFTLFQRPKLPESYGKSNNINKIKYKCVKDTNKMVVLQPVQVKKFKDKHYVCVPLRTAKHNRLVFYRHYKINIYQDKYSLKSVE